MGCALWSCGLQAPEERRTRTAKSRMLLALDHCCRLCLMTPGRRPSASTTTSASPAPAPAGSGAWYRSTRRQLPASWPPQSPALSWLLPAPFINPLSLIHCPPIWCTYAAQRMVQENPPDEDAWSPTPRSSTSNCMKSISLDLEKPSEVQRGASGSCRTLRSALGGITPPAPSV
jgi:hypothetical protein